MSKKKLTDSAKLAAAKPPVKDIRKGIGYGYEYMGAIAMIRCFQCGMENWAMMVTSGICAFCSYDANVDVAYTPDSK